MQNTIESSTSYVVALFSMVLATLVDSSNTILALGGLVLLGLRLYVEISNIKKLRSAA